MIGRNFSSGLYINSEALPNPISVDWEVSWSLLHQVKEKEKKCEENKYPAPKLTAANLHPGISKQNITKTLAIFEPSTIAADRICTFLNPRTQQAFFILFTCGRRYQARTRCSIAMTDSEMQQNYMKVNLSFWRLVAASKDLQLWKIHSVPSVQCSTGPYTLRCHTNLFDILLNEQYQFVLTVRLQSDPVGKRLGQYC